MIDDYQRARYLNPELGDRRSACRHQCGLDILLVVGTTFGKNLVEDFSDNVKAADQIRPAVADEQSNGFAGLGT